MKRSDPLRRAAFLAAAALALLPAPGEAAGGERVDAGPGEKEHAALFDAKAYPSAAECGVCHKQIYREWSASNHAYSGISPMFHKFEQKINDLTTGTIGTFCVRCHIPVGTAMGEPREISLGERQPVSREGVTCIACHRVNEEYGKVNAERRIVPGDIHQPVYGGIGGGGVEEVVGKADFYKVAVEPGQRGMSIHRAGVRFEQLSRSEFCVSCHQVAVHPNIKLEVVWDQYRASPAFEAGTTCQDCHMSKEPGVASGYAKGPAAEIGGKVANAERKHANHSFPGPGYPITHPGIFPHNPRANQFSLDTWLKFDWQAGWGTDAFEDRVARGEIEVEFPPEWDSVDDRFDAREILEENLERLEEKRELRRKVMENGSTIEGPFFDGKPRAGRSLRFHYLLTNTNPGHNLPSGSLGAQPEVWLNVALIDPGGRNVWESGYVDANGDMADLHSLEVAAGRIEHDDQLFNLQTKFLTTNVKGTDREMYLPVNFDLDQIPFIRPGNIPTTVTNHPPFVRMEGRSIPPLGKRKAEYTLPASALGKPGSYRLAVRMRSRAEPIYFMRFVGATREMERSMNEWMVDIHPYTVEFQVEGPESAARATGDGPPGGMPEPDARSPEARAALEGKAGEEPEGGAARPRVADFRVEDAPSDPPPAGEDSPEAMQSPEGWVQADLPDPAAGAEEEPEGKAARVTPSAGGVVDHDPGVFGPDPAYEGKPYDAGEQVRIYGDKHWNKTERPLLELGRPLYTAGPFRPSRTYFGRKNLGVPGMMAFGDWRTAAAYNDAGANGKAILTTRLNLDLDFRFTATERLHAFTRPLDGDGRFTGVEVDEGDRTDDLRLDADPDALFFEGDLGPILAGMSGRDNRIDLPFALGLMPLLFQNGVWVEDAFTGLAVTIPAFNSPRLDISNADITLFAAFDKVSSPALVDPAGVADDHDASLYGLNFFLEANEGFWEFGTGYVDGRGAGVEDLDYWNVSAAFTRRFGAVLSNSVRVIGNFGQEPVGRERTADGYLVLLENSFITRRPTTLIPYANAWVGVHRPQSLARDAGAGGVLKNTGLLFETDGLTGFPKLDDTARDTYGVALGLEYLFALNQQIVFEVAGLDVRGDEMLVPAQGSQYGAEVRYQRPIGGGWIFRADAMGGWREDQEDLAGARVEIRRKF